MLPTLLFQIGEENQKLAYLEYKKSDDKYQTLKSEVGTPRGGNGKDSFRGERY